jgi:polyhydroxyalkanoate synthesis regulator phasin
MRAGPDGGPVLRDDVIDQIRETLREQVRSGNLPADEQQRILEHLNDAERIRREVHERLKQRIQELDRRLEGLDDPAPPGPAVPGPDGADRPEHEDLN